MYRWVFEVLPLCVHVVCDIVSRFTFDEQPSQLVVLCVLDFPQLQAFLTLNFQPPILNKQYVDGLGALWSWYIMIEK